MNHSRSFVGRWLATRGEGTLNLFAVAAAFSTYFCMYAFRKPFAAATYTGDSVVILGHALDQKTLYVISQIVGYALSKYAGIKFCSETSRPFRLPALVGLIVAAEAALVMFGVFAHSAPGLKAIAVFANGLPLGMVWGLVVLYLEGRRTSEFLLTGLSCSFIVASGIVKDIGRAILAGADFPLPVLSSWGWSIPNPLPPVPDFWMPSCVGALFLPLFLLSSWLLDQIPDPTASDVLERVERVPMWHADRLAFVSRYSAGILAALTAYLLLTAYRDYRDNYAVEVFTQLGYDYSGHQTIVSRTEILVAFGVMAVLSQLYRVRDNRLGLIAVYGVMAAGLLLVGIATLLFDARYVSGFWWITLIGLGAYLAYVPFNSMLFDRIIASTRFTGTAVFGIYLADAVGYSGSVVMQLSKDLALGTGSHLEFLRLLSYVLAVVGTAGLIVSCLAFLRQSAREPRWSVGGAVAPPESN